ncbi:AAA family ATPase [Thiopseudomonas alkaliphila]|uniref:AAA family ATPase n=1 Tax=Thiopseudomonas alkaliphila TaxID=1697053 RepID=UPI002577D7EF|nr:AAA family ATPase [Thiopseudomonas alkaliphila]MDM1708163.1 AAA family ATPase [Thiopseudomonas alkaliphila]
MRNDVRDLHLVLEAKVKLIALESWDEVRVLETLTQLAIQRALPMYVWSISQGLNSLDFFELEKTETTDPALALRQVLAAKGQGLYVFCDLHPFLADNPLVVRLLKEVAMATEQDKPTIILVSHQLDLPVEVQRLSARLSLALPSEEELHGIVREEALRWSRLNQGTRVKTDQHTLSQVVSNLQGMNHADARMLARRLICDDGAITQEDVPELNKAKFALLNLDGVLTYEADVARFAEVGGLANLKRWLGQRRTAFLRNSGTDLPKGVLLVGVQGSGKSLAAKAVAGLWGLPLLRLDFGSLYNKFFGETERNLREALRMAEQMSPCVLWMDEIEKGIASGELDGGVSQRVLGTLLTWLAERKQPVFTVATANAIHRLPPELVRKGRFDELFFVDLPTLATRKEIFAIHLTKRELAVSSFKLEELAQQSEGFSGAEIEQVIVAAFYTCNARGIALSQAALIEEIQKTVPLSVTLAESLTALREWAQDRTVPAE